MLSAPAAAALVGGALALFAWVGFRERASQRAEVEDYVLARGSQTAGTLASSFLASGLGAWVLFAAPEVGAFVGIAGVLGYAVGAAAPIAALAVVGTRLRTLVPAGHSLTEFVRLRFGRAFHAYVVGVSILYMLMFLTAELTAVGGVVALLSGLDPRLVVVAVAVVTLAYTAYGGLRASLRTDRWQAWLVALLLTVGLGAVVSVVATPASALTASGLLGIDRVGIEAALTLVIAVTAANLFHQGYWQRVWAAADPRALQRGALGGAFLSMPVVLLVGVAGILAVGAGLELGNPPLPLFALFAGLSPWVSAVVVVLGVALVASSVDTLENALASLVAVERPRLSLAGARWVTVGLMVPSAVVAFQGHSVLRLLLVADLLCATAVVPALLGLWRGATPAGAISGAVAGLVGAVGVGAVSTGSVREGLALATFPGSVPTLAPFLGAIVVSTVVALLVSSRTNGGGDLDGLNERVPALG